MKTVRWIRLIMTASVIVTVLGCFGEKVIIPVYDKPVDQFVFAKRIKDRAYLIADKKRREKEFKNAILGYKKVLELFPEDEQFAPLAMISLADCYAEVGSLKKAIKTYEQTLKKYPEQSDIQASALFGAGMAYDRLGSHEKAQFYFKECMERFASDERPLIKDLVARSKLQYGRIKEK
jgi:tetratricopeptide (TPR) repeat protein